MTSQAGILDEIEKDLGIAARLRVLANAGGQRRYIPQPDGVIRSDLARELGPDVAYWLAGRYGGDLVTFPSRHGTERQDKAALLQAAVLDAGLTEPKRSANDIASEFGVTARYVHMVRASLKSGTSSQPSPQADLFD